MVGLEHLVYNIDEMYVKHSHLLLISWVTQVGVTKIILIQAHVFCLRVATLLQFMKISVRQTLPVSAYI